MKMDEQQKKLSHERLQKKLKAIEEMSKTPMNYKEELERHTKMKELAMILEKEATKEI